MTRSFFNCCIMSLNILFAVFLLSVSPALAADGLKWDGNRYPFKALDPSKPNSESNPFIIDTAGKLAFLSWLAGRGDDMDFEIVGYGKANGLKGLNVAFRNNYVKLTADLDMNGSQFELRSIAGGVINFDGGGHVIDNYLISDKLTPVKIDPQEGTVEIYLGLFEDAESIKNLTVGKRARVIFKGGTKYTNSVWAGGIAAQAYKIDNCSSDASLTINGEGDTLVGGVAAECGFLTNSSFRGSVTVSGKVISSFDKNKHGKIVPGELRVGGVCARTDKILSGCYNTGSITVNSSGSIVEVGGVSADLNSCVCTDLYNTGSIRLNADGDIKNGSVGGVIGYGGTFGRIYSKGIEGYNDSGYIYNKGTIDVAVQTGNEIDVGGITGGKLTRDATFSTGFYSMTGVYGVMNAYNAGAVSVSSTGKAEINAGGITGSGLMVINSYNTGRISGTSGSGATLSIGGLGGKAVYVQNCYSIGSVTAKGTGTNSAGGILGTASGTVWGETETSLSSTLNGFWLKQAGGINSDIKYGKGSYFYMRKGDIKKDALGTALDRLAKDDPNVMVEDTFGSVFSFNSPSAAVMTRTDDGPGKRANLDGTLLYNLNEMVEDKVNRAYRRWIVDGTNGGYPVLSSKPTLYNKNPEKPDAAAAKKIAGQYLGVQTKWNDTIMFNADGTFKRTLGGDGGTWAYNGTRIILKWTKWAPEILKQKPTGEFSSNIYTFTLTRTDSINTGAKPDEATAKKIAGQYAAQHKADWSGTMLINADGTFKVVEGGDGGKWSFDGTQLILSWSTCAPEILQMKSDTLFSSSSYKFTLKRSGPPAAAADTSDIPVSADVKKYSGTYYAVHKDWTDSLKLNTDGTFIRGKGDGGTWTFANRKLTLKWSKTGLEETLIPSATGFACLAYKFSLRR
jgi:hypothetical protein